MINENESSNIIFCLDISGSMYKEYKGGNSNAFCSEKGTVIRDRFDFMKSFINNNLAQIIKKNPNCKVGILIFGNKV